MSQQVWLAWGVRPIKHTSEKQRFGSTVPRRFVLSWANLGPGWSPLPQGVSEGRLDQALFPRVCGLWLRVVSMREPGRERGRGLASRFWPGASRRMWEQRPHTHDVRECCLPGRLRKPQTWKGRARPIPGQCGGPGLITAQLIKSWSGRYLGPISHSP